MKKFYITTTLPYVNAEPHIGFALEIVQADVLARYHDLLEDKVFFNFGTDEHGLKIFRKAEETKKDPQAYVDEYAARFSELQEALNLSYNSFIRTTDQHHVAAAQEFWKRCLANGDIYKKNYKIKYCVGCELEKTDSELVDEKCPLHPKLTIEVYEEENYFFRFSKYQKPLLMLYEQHAMFVIPEEKFNEIKAFVKRGLDDFSISRLKAKMPWGIDVPNDPDHVMYVWFDALINYISALGWPEDEKKFKDFWPGLQVAGKDNLRQQSAIWQAMLLSAGLPNSKQIFIHGFITVDGQKISKSLGNVINPLELVEKYGTDAVRYYLLAKIHPWEDSDFTYEKFEESYNADLANGLGNLVARVAKLCENADYTHMASASRATEHTLEDAAYKQALDEFRFNEALSFVWKKITRLDQYINEEQPWKLLKTEPQRAAAVLAHCVDQIQEIGLLLDPFLPETSEKILTQFKGPKIKSSISLFPRIEARSKS
jgi:methionyl-tRNA synthetase